MNFDDAFERLIGHEGGYTDNPADPGGETKYGISKRSYPKVDIKNLTLEGAKAIYLRDYWLTAKCDALPARLMFDVFDTAVNSGVDKAVKLLQSAVKVEADGVIGPVSLAAIRGIDATLLIARYNGARLMFMTELKTWPSFSRGWARRIALNLLEA